MVERWLSLAATIEGTALATWLRSSAWGYPAVESLHLLGLALLVGSAAAFDIRLLRVASPLPVHLVARLLLPLARIGFGVAVVSGAVLFMMQARTFAVMPLFFLKMGTIAVAVANTLAFHHGIFTSVSHWTQDVRAPHQARRAAVVSLLCWALVLVCGRFLAYV